jgi:hypothetical protein
MHIPRREVTITEADNGWIVNYFGGDALGHSKVFTSWGGVLEELKSAFDIEGDWNAR